MTDIVGRIREEVRDWKCGPVVSEAADEIERLRAAITLTLKENAHLADGENCALIHLKRAIEAQP